MDPLTFKDIVDTFQAEAIANHLSPTEESVLRSIYRSYAYKFNTPLHEVYKLEFDFIAINLYESQLENVDALENLEEITDMIRGIEDPEYQKNKEEALQEDISIYEEMEEARVMNKKPIWRKSQPVVPVEEPPKELPKSGGINLSYLEDLDNEK